MNKVTIIGEIAKPPSLAKTKNKELVLRLTIKYNAREYVAYVMGDKVQEYAKTLKAEMIVQCEGHLIEFVLGNIGKYHDVFKIVITNVIVLYETKEKFKTAKGVGLNGKSFPF